MEKKLQEFREKIKEKKMIEGALAGIAAVTRKKNA